MVIWIVLFYYAVSSPTLPTFVFAIGWTINHSMHHMSSEFHNHILSCQLHLVYLFTEWEKKVPTYTSINDGNFYPVSRKIALCFPTPGAPGLAVIWNPICSNPVYRNCIVSRPIYMSQPLPHPVHQAQPTRESFHSTRGNGNWKKCGRSISTETT